MSLHADPAPVPTTTGPFHAEKPAPEMASVKHKEKSDDA